MIDIENMIFTELKTFLVNELGDISISSDLSFIPTSFPHITIVEQSNQTYLNTIDSGSNENHARIMYEINIYSNATTGRKQETKNIFDKVDNYMTNKGFNRISTNPFMNTKLFRLVIRYEGIVNKNKEIFRR